MSAPDQDPEQATVLTVHPDGALTLVRDDGTRVPAPAPAVAAGGWRAPRPGQRVAVRRGPGGQVTAVLLPVPGDGHP